MVALAVNDQDQAQAPGQRLVQEPFEFAVRVRAGVRHARVVTHTSALLGFATATTCWRAPLPIT